MVAKDNFILYTNFFSNFPIFNQGRMHYLFLLLNICSGDGKFSRNNFKMSAFIQVVNMVVEKNNRLCKLQYTRQGIFFNKIFA